MEYLALTHQPDDGQILLLEKGKFQLFAPYTEGIYNQVLERLEKWMNGVKQVWRLDVAALFFSLPFMNAIFQS